MKRLILYVIIIIYLSNILQAFNCQIDYNAYSNEKLLKQSDFDDVFGDIEVVRPSHSEIIIIGQLYLIKWDSKGGIDLISIGLYKDFDFIEYITLVTINDECFEWEVGFYDESSDYSIGIWDYNDFNCGDFSDNFIITLGKPNVQKYLSIIGLILSFCALTILIYNLFLIILRHFKIKSHSLNS